MVCQSAHHDSNPYSLDSFVLCEEGHRTKMPHGGHVRCLRLNPEAVAASSMWVCNSCRPSRRPRGQGSVNAVQESIITANDRLETNKNSLPVIRSDRGIADIFLLSTPAVPQRLSYPSSRARVSKLVDQVLSPNLFEFLTDEVNGNREKERVKDLCDEARLVDGFPEMEDEVVAPVRRPEQMAVLLQTRVSQRLEVQGEHTRLQIEGLTGLLSSPVIMVPDASTHLDGQMHEIEPSSFGFEKHPHRSSNEPASQVSIEMVSRFPYDMYNVPYVGTRRITDLMSNDCPVQELSIGVNVLEPGTLLDPTCFSEEFTQVKHPHRDDG